MAAQDKLARAKDFNSRLEGFPIKSIELQADEIEEVKEVGAVAEAAAAEGLNLDDADAVIEGFADKALAEVEEAGGFPVDGESVSTLRELPAEEAITPISTLRELPAEEVITPIQPEPVAETGPKEGPLGIVSKETRGAVRETIEEQPGLLQLLAEIAPSVGGAAGGAAIGLGVGGPPGALVGAVIGGFGGEVLAQETGVAPASELNLALSAGGPLLGPAISGTFKGAKILAGRGFSKLPFAKTARAANTVGNVVEEFESVGTRILAKQEGIIARTSGELYTAVRKAGVTVPGKSLNNTRTAIGDLIQEMDAIKAFPEVRQALNHLKRVVETIAPGKPSKILDVSGNALSVPSSVSIDTLVALRQQLGLAVKRAQSAGGLKLGSAKKAFAAISDDLDRIATNPNLSGRGARLAKAAVKRAKLEFSVKDMETAVARFTKDEGKDGVSISIKGLQKWMRDITNPKSKKFSKNFAESLKDEIPAIKERLEVLSKIVGAGSAGGPGSIVIRGRGARAGVGLLAGLGLSGGIGSLVGAQLGANLPEMLVAMLTTKTGAKFLEGAANAGKGAISWKSWVAGGTAIIRSLGDKNEPSSLGEFERKRKLTSGQGN